MRSTHRAVLAAAVFCLSVGSLVNPIAALTAPAEAATTTPDFTQSKTMTRTFVEADGSITTVDTRNVTVTVDVTQDIQPRQVINVSWTGAHPSAARASTPLGYQGLQQEYPVVIMQCRGVDDPSLPSDQQLKPETCYTASYNGRSARSYPSLAVWPHDRFWTAADTPDMAAHLRETIGLDETGKKCEGWESYTVAAYAVPFVGVDGTVYDECSPSTQTTQQNGNPVTPPNETASLTRADGTGATQFEVRTAEQIEALGCSADVPCSLVVIPIMGISCADSNADCRKTGSGDGTVNLPGDPAVSGSYWWTPSNWMNRISVPLSFAPRADLCARLDSRAPVQFAGSELLSQASTQWAPAYCLNAGRFKYAHNRMGDTPALNSLASNSVVGAFVSRPSRSGKLGGSEIAYAPTAVTGWGIGYVIDKPTTGETVTNLRLTPRLLAKLLTQSYRGARISPTDRPDMANNPKSILLDPEFIALNPDITDYGSDTMAVLSALSVPADVMYSVTAYIAADPDALAFVNGQPDPWGMTVNSSYRGISVPTESWPLLDTFTPAYPNDECSAAMYANQPYLGRLAAPVNSLNTIVEALLDAHPLAQTACVTNGGQGADKIYKPGRAELMSYGARFMMGLVDIPDANRHGIAVASLSTAGSSPTASFVAPTTDTMAAAVATATQSAAGQPFLLDAADLHNAAAAYPGTMIVHTAVKLSGLSASTAQTLADFIRISTSEGQVQGNDIGELPPGYLPIVNKGVTAPLYASARKVATAVEGQVTTLSTAGTVKPTSSTTSSSGTGSGGSTSGGTALTGGSTDDVSGQVLADDGGPVTVDGLPADDTTVPALATGSRTLTDTVRILGPLSGTVPGLLGISAAGLLGAPLLRRGSARRAAKQ